MLTGSSDTFHEEMKEGSVSVWLSLNTHLWLLSAATLPTNLEKKNHIIIIIFPCQTKVKGRKLEIGASPFTKIIDLMRHFEKDISTKPSFHMSTTVSFTFTEITETIFPNKNPEVKTKMPIPITINITKQKELNYSSSSLFLQV